MDETTKNNLSNRNIWARILYMVLFAIAYNLAEAIIFFIALFQIIVVLFTGKTNAALQQFGANLSEFAYQIFQFMTFNSEHLPFPFNDWPEAEVGETPYDESHKAEPDTPTTTAEQDDVPPPEDPPEDTRER